MLCHHVTVDGQNINITLVLISLGTAIAQSVIKWWRKEIVGRRSHFLDLRSHFLDRTRHFWCRIDRLEGGELGGVLGARLEQQHSEQLTTMKNATRPTNKAMYHTTDHGSNTHLFSERKRIDAKCQFRFPQGGMKLPLQKQFPAPLFVMYNKV